MAERPDIWNWLDIFVKNDVRGYTSIKSHFLFLSTVRMKRGFSGRIQGAAEWGMECLIEKTSPKSRIILGHVDERLVSGHLAWKTKDVKRVSTRTFFTKECNLAMDGRIIHLYKRFSPCAV